MNWLTDAFALSFQQRALAGGALAAIALALVGSWMVIRGTTFLGDALVHGILPGIAAAMLLQVSILLGAAAAAGVMLLGIGLVHRQTRFPEDTGIGLLFVGMLALGVILISQTSSYSGSLARILFGDALGITAADIGILAVVVVLSTLVTMLMYRPLLVLSFNQQKAQLLGLRPRLTHAVHLALLTLVVVGTFRTVGTLLVFGLLVGPAATAALLVRRVPAMMLLAVGIGVGSVAVGLLVSFHANTAGSATMALVPIVLFFVVLAIRALATRGRGAS